MVRGIVLKLSDKKGMIVEGKGPILHLCRRTEAVTANGGCRNQSYQNME